jgi:hypothetical protein
MLREFQPHVLAVLEHPVRLRYTSPSAFSLSATFVGSPGIRTYWICSAADTLGRRASRYSLLSVRLSKRRAGRYLGAICQPLCLNSCRNRSIYSFCGAYSQSTSTAD